MTLIFFFSTPPGARDHWWTLLLRRTGSFPPVLFLATGASDYPRGSLSFPPPRSLSPPRPCSTPAWRLFFFHMRCCPAAFFRAVGGKGFFEASVSAPTAGAQFPRGGNSKPLPPTLHFRTVFLFLPRDTPTTPRAGSIAPRARSTLFLYPRTDPPFLLRFFTRRDPFFPTASNGCSLFLFTFPLCGRSGRAFFLLSSDEKTSLDR